MNRLQKATLIVEMLDKMIKKGSWAGETHLQKCVFFLQNMRSVPIGYEFQLYKYGPFSFDLRDDLLQLQAESMVDLSPRSSSYGSSLAPSDTSLLLRKHFPRTLKRYQDEISFVADHFGSLNARDLGRLATAYYFYLKGGNSSDEEIGELVNSVKPYITVSEGADAARQISSIASVDKR